MNCPKCNHPIPDKDVLSAGAKIMQAKGRKNRTYTSEAATKAAKAKWTKYYKDKAK